MQVGKHTSFMIIGSHRECAGGGGEGHAAGRLDSESSKLQLYWANLSLSVFFCLCLCFGK